MPEQSLPVGPASSPLGENRNGNHAGVNDAGNELNIPEQVGLLRIVASSRPSPLTYTSALAEEQDGLRWGIVGFRQLNGEVGEVLRKAAGREQKLLQEEQLAPEHELVALFGEHWQALVAQTDPTTTTDPAARMAALDGSALWEGVWLDRFAHAGSIPYVQAAQNEIAVHRVAVPARKIAAWLGLDSPLGSALMMSLIVDQGQADGAMTVVNAVGPIRTEADRDSALQATTGSTNLAAFQASRGLNADGIWDALSHVALIGALRELGSSSPLVVLNPEQMVTTLLNATRGTSVGASLQALVEHPELNANHTYADA